MNKYWSDRNHQSKVLCFKRVFIEHTGIKNYVTYIAVFNALNIS